MTTNFQIASDLHIEMDFGKLPIWQRYLDKVSDILILIGDIGRLDLFDQYRAFIKCVCTEWNKVILIPGNHEFYVTVGITPQTYKMRWNMLRTIEAENINLTVLFNDYIDLPGNLRLFGSVLWSYIPEDCRYRCIPILIDQNNWASPTWINKEHFNAVYELEQNMIKAKIDGKRLLVATHYAPIKKGCLSEENLKDKNNCYYTNDLERLLDKNYVYTWMFGHTHFNCDYRVNGNGTRLVTNQYRGCRYEKNKILSIRHV